MKPSDSPDVVITVGPDDEIVAYGGGGGAAGPAMEASARTMGAGGCGGGGLREDEGAGACGGGEGIRLYETISQEEFYSVFEGTWFQRARMDLRAAGRRVAETVRRLLRRRPPAPDRLGYLSAPTPFQLGRSLVDRDLDTWPRYVTIGTLVTALALGFVAGLLVGGVF